MARPQKRGLDYFPLDVGFFEDDKIQLISAEFGIKAESLILRLLCKIYKEGYYYKWGADQCLLMAKSMGVVGCSKEWISEVIQGLIRRRFFDEGCFNQFAVLTSTAIQSRYIKATNERKNVGLDKPFWLLSSQAAPSSGVNPPINGVNPPINTQSKAKKSKVKKSKDVEGKDVSDQSTSVDLYTTSENPNSETSQIDSKKPSKQRKKVPQKKESVVDPNFTKFQEWIDVNAPDVANFAQPFTQVEFVRLKDEFPLDVIQGLILAMYNKSAHKNNLSANLTFRAWHKRDSENKNNNSNNRNNGEYRRNNGDDIHPTNSTTKQPTRRTTL